MKRLNNVLPSFLPVIVLLCLTGKGFSQSVQRKALMGIRLSETEKGLRVDSILLNSSAEFLKLKKNDILISLNNSNLKTIDDYNRIATQIRADDKVSFKLTRGTKQVNVSGKAVPRPLETSEYADVYYDLVKFRQGYLRAITRKPKGKEKLPCILLIPGYGCGSIENYSGSYNGRLIDEWLKNGYAVVTIEKSGLGDSYNCVPCVEADLATDVDSYNAGYTYMKGLAFADTTNLFIWGHSLGGMVAPEVAKRHHPKGVLVFGTVFRPWSEFLLEMHRIQKPLLEGMSYEDTEVFTRLIQKVYYEFFVLKRTREQLYENPEYKSIVGSELEYKPGNTTMWGRHWRFWQQIDSLNLAKTWGDLNCKVLVLNGATDYEQCAPIEPILIEKTVNRAHPGNATRIQIEELDHFMMKSKTFEEAAANFKLQEYAKGNFNQAIADESIRWLNRVSKKP
jgi:pimeloyl-ACP methyl ester carboxylesterase